ncbi:MAG: hypothetical protein HLUCCA08_07620 [Rhodobacteraceae bacterium HLUCCA08]|nr:MAG: hypothetical protein HLUCCA08_07620 [Rhodobacteraceae bacterium HLUCCA08]
MTGISLLSEACIAATTAAAHAETPKEQIVAAIEAAGCVADRSHITESLDGPGLADDDVRIIGDVLIAQGQAQVSDAGAFQPTTPNCNQGERLMKSLPSRILSLLAFALPLLALPAHAWEVEEIGKITATFDDETFERSTVIVTDGDLVSPTANLFLSLNNFSGLSLMTEDADFVVEANFMSHAPGPETAPISTSVTYASPDGNMQFWQSEGAPEPLEVTFTTLSVEGDKGHAAGSFRGVLCLADGLGAEVDPDNCRPIEGTFDTPFFVEE